MTAITTMLLTTAIMTITTSTTTAMVMMMALLLLLLLRLRLWLMILRCYTVSVPMIEQVRANFYVRFHILIVTAGLITTAVAARWIPAATISHRSVCTCTFYVAATAAAIQSVRHASLFVIGFHIS